MISVNFVLTVPFGGVGGTVQGVQATATGPQQVPLPLAGCWRTQEAELTAPPASPSTPKARQKIIG